MWADSKAGTEGKAGLEVGSVTCTGTRYFTEGLIQQVLQIIHDVREPTCPLYNSSFTASRMAPTGPFPRRANLPDPGTPCPDKNLAADTRTVDNLSAADYWARVCPGLHVGGKLQGVKPLKAPDGFVADVKSQINSEGVCQVMAAASLGFWVKVRAMDVAPSCLPRLHGLLKAE